MTAQTETEGVTPTALTPRAHAVPRLRSWFDATRRFVTRHPWVAVVSLAVAGAIAAWERIPVTARDTLWAEDGRTFLQGAINDGSVASLFVPYAGYLHTVPRLIASIVVTGVPVSGWSLGMTAGSCIVAGIMAATVFVATRGLIRWMPARVFIASLTVLAPLAPREVLGNATNLHSLFLWTLFWILLARPRTRSVGVGLAIVGLLAALTEIQSLLLLPLLLFRLGDRRRWIPRAAVVLGAAAQLAVTIIFPRAHSPKPPVEPLSVLYGYVINAVMPLGVAQRSIGPALATVGPLLAVLLVVPIVAAFVIVARRGTAVERVIAIGLLLVSIGVYGASVVTNPDLFYDYASFTPAELTHAWLTRYGIVPSMMLAAVVAMGLSVAITTRNRGRPWWASRRTVAFGLVGALLAVSLLAQFTPQLTRRSDGPAWQPQLAAAREDCETLPANASVSLRETIHWHVVVPCRILDPDQKH